MARKSTGTPPPPGLLLDDAQAWQQLCVLHHFRVARVNRGEGKRALRVDVTHAGRRVSATAGTLLEATSAAMEKLRMPPYHGSA